jgi:hypothetical protein
MQKALINGYKITNKRRMQNSKARKMQLNE